MAPVAGKRGRSTAAATEVKKARHADPITEKVEFISKTISQPECQLQASHREMLLAALPHVLTVPSDQRHGYQTQVAEMMHRVLNDYVSHWEQLVSESKENISASSEKARIAMKIVEESASRSFDKEEEVTKCKEVVKEDSEAFKAAGDALQSASKEVAEFDEKMQLTIAKKDHCSSIYNEAFTTLKTGGVDAKDVARLTKEVHVLLKELSAEPSLLSAIAPAFTKAPEARGPFDNMAIEGAETVFNKHLAEFREQISKADETKDEKIAAEKACQDNLEAAKEKKVASEAAQKAAEEELASLESKHGDLLKALDVAHAESNSSESVVATKEARFADVQKALSEFTELFERQSAVAEPATNDSVIHEKVETLCEPTSMEITA